MNYTDIWKAKRLYAIGILKTHTCWIPLNQLRKVRDKQYWTNGGIRYARGMWYRVNGVIPKGKQLLHICDNPYCVRPDHLYIGSAKDNQLDCISKGRKHTRRGIKRKQLTIDQVKAIRKDVRHHSLIATEYNVGRNCIGRIKRYETHTGRQ